MSTTRIGILLVAAAFIAKLLLGRLAIGYRIDEYSHRAVGLDSIVFWTLLTVGGLILFWQVIRILVAGR